LAGGVECAENLDLEFGEGGEPYKRSVYDAPRRWAWAINSVGKTLRGPVAAFEAYQRNGVFFDVVWQVNLPRPGKPDTPSNTHRVRLQVESSNAALNNGLNGLKLELIRAIETSNVREVVKKPGFRYDITRVKTSKEDVNQYKTTTVFCAAELSYEQSALPPRKKIELVHSKVGSTIDKIIQQYADEVDKYFPGASGDLCQCE
jgi:hypothetical protein